MEQSSEEMKDGLLITAFGAQGWCVGEGQRSIASQEGAVSNPICPRPARPDHPPPLGAAATFCLSGELHLDWPSLENVAEPRGPALGPD